jgi:small subunit ribosomal protein S16
VVLTRRERSLHPSFTGETTAVAVKIKLKRMGKIHAPYYRIIVADARTKRDGRAIEEIGKYHPKNEPSFIEVDSERAQHWLSVGAQPTDPVRKILEITGDWQKFKGLPGAEGTLKVAAPKADKKDAYNAAVTEALGTGDGAKAKGRKPGAKADGDQADADASGTKAGSGRSAGRSGGKQATAGKGAKADTGKADTAKADTAKADAAQADTGKVDAAQADTGKADAAQAEAPKADAAEPAEGEKPAKASAAKASTDKASTDEKPSTEKASTAKAKAADSAEAEPVAAEQGDGA